MKPLDRTHEYTIAQQVIRILHPNATFARMGDDRTEPDVVFQFNNRVIGIEVTTAYYEDIMVGDTELSPSAKMCGIIQKQINKKSLKQYTGVDEIILAIEMIDPATDELSMQLCIAQLVTPVQHPFNRIIVVHNDRQGGEKQYELFQVYPQQTQIIR